MVTSFTVPTLPSGSRVPGGHWWAIRATSLSLPSDCQAGNWVTAEQDEGCIIEVLSLKVYDLIGSTMFLHANDLANWD